MSISSDEGEYETKSGRCATSSSPTVVTAAKDEEGKVGKGKVSSCPELSLYTAFTATRKSTGRNGYALELAFRSRKSVCVDTIEYLKVVFTFGEEFPVQWCGSSIVRVTCEVTLFLFSIQKFACNAWILILSREFITEESLEANVIINHDMK